MQAKPLLDLPFQKYFHPQWAMLGVSSLSLFVCHASVVILTFGVFLKPLMADFGWERGPTSLILTMHAIGALISMPIAGRLIDHYGARQVLIPSFIIYALVIMSLGMLPGNLLAWYGAFVVVAFVGACTGPLPHSKVLVTWFQANRGLALGISIASIGVGSFVFTLISQYLIDYSGWHFAFMALGVIVFLIGFPVIFLYLRNGPDHSEASLSPSKQNAEKHIADTCNSVSSKDALRSKTFWLLVVAFILPSIAIAGVTLHLPALLTDRGMAAQTAAIVLGVLGISSTIGRVFVGWLLDRYFAPYVAIVFFLIPALGCFLLFLGASGSFGFVAAICIGLGMGAEIDIIAYITSRYFGLRNFTEIYGYLFGAFSVGAALGAILLGFGYDYTGGYFIPLLMSIAALLSSCVVLVFVGPYPKHVTS